MGTQKNRLNEHPKHMFKLMDKKIITFLHTKVCLFGHIRINTVNILVHIFFQIYYGASTNFEVKGLSPNTLYSFRVQAINSAGAGLYSPVSTCVTPPSSPSTVLSIRASPSATDVLLQWKEPHNNGSEIHAYNIDIGDKQLICISAVTEYSIEGLTPETAYK